MKLVLGKDEEEQMKNEEIVLRKYIQEAFFPIVYPEPKGLRERLEAQFHEQLTNAEESLPFATDVGKG